MQHHVKQLYHGIKKLKTNLSMMHFHESNQCDHQSKQDHAIHESNGTEPLKHETTEELNQT